MPKRPRRTPTAQPHDSFLKFVFAEREHAAGLLKTLLPAEIAAAFDWATLVLASPNGGDALKAILQYLLSTHPRVEAPKIVELVETTASRESKEIVMDVLDVFRKEGRVEGRVEGRAKTLLELLTARFGPVPAAVKTRIKAAKEAELSRWSLRVLTAPTLEAVLDEPARKGAKAPKSVARK